MWFLLLLMFFQGNPTPCQSAAPLPPGSPSVVVQAVDPDYLPISGATVTVKALGGSAQSFSARTEDGGYAKFFFPVNAGIAAGSGYSIEVKMPNFKTSRVNQLRLHSPSESPHVPYVQLVMKISTRNSVTVY